MTARNVGLMGQYAGIVTRGIALLIDIVIVIVSVLVISAAVRLPLNFFLDINPEACAEIASDGSLDRFLVGLQQALCNTVDVALLIVALLAGPVYFIFLATAGGQTVGKYIMGVRIVRLDGRAMGYPQAAIRWLGYVVSLLPLGLGFFWAIVDDRRRTFHDRLAGTCVIYAWRAQQNDYLLERIHRFFGRVTSRKVRSLLAAIIDRPTELVTLAVSRYSDLQTMMRIAKNGLVDGEFDILGLQEYVKSEDGVLSPLGSDMYIDMGVKAVELSAITGMTADVVKQINAEIPDDHFVVIMLVNERDADKLVKVISRRTAAQIRRYPLNDILDKIVYQPGAGRTVGKTAVQESAAPFALRLDSQPIPPGANAAAVSPAATGIDAVAPELVESVDILKSEQAALRAELERKSELLLTLEQQVRDADATLASTLAAVESDRALLEQLRAGYAATPSPQRQSSLPSMQHDEAVSDLPASKKAAIDAAVDLRVVPQVIAIPQNLTAIKGIGPKFEQRLYSAGVGSYWEVAVLTDGELRSILALTDLQAKTVDLKNIRGDARRLAEETGAMGFIWQGHRPDDFEVIEGIGPVFQQRLYTAGIRTFDALAQSTPEQLTQIVAAAKPSQPDYVGWIEQAQRLSQQKLL